MADKEMKKYSFLILLVVLWANFSYAQSTVKISELAVDSTPTSTDYLMTVDMEAVGGADNRKVSLGNFANSIAAFLGPITSTSVTLTKSDGIPGNICVYEAAGTGTDSVCLRGPDSRSSSLYLKYPDADPTAGQVVSYGVPSSSISTGSWITPAQEIASGTSAMGTGAISSASCATVVTTSATGVATTDVIKWSFNADPTAITGYAPASGGSLKIIAYPTSNNVNFKVCNDTANSITPGSAITLNWRVDR